MLRHLENRQMKFVCLFQALVRIAHSGLLPFQVAISLTRATSFDFTTESAINYKRVLCLVFITITH